MNSFNSIYNFVSGPLVWLAFIIFIGGSIYRIRNLIILVNKKERFIYTYMSLKYSLRSISHWIVPFATISWRARPVMTITTFIFHGSLPEGFTDAVTLLVILCCVIFLLRRVALRDVNFLTDASDYAVLLIAAAPFITGFLAYHNIGSYHFWIILHILSGEIMLVAIPFTKLRHMIYAVFTRAYIGSEFGKVRHARDW